MWEPSNTVTTNMASHSKLACVRKITFETAKKTYKRGTRPNQAERGQPCR